MWHAIFIKPIFNLLIIIYNLVPYKDMGLAVVLLTILIKLALSPFQHKTSVNQAKMGILAPKLKEIKEKHKKDLAKQAQEMNKLYKEHKVSPFSGFLFMIVQLIIIIALYKVFYSDFSQVKATKDLYSFVANPGKINLIFLGILNITKKSLTLALITAIFQYFQSKISLRTQVIPSKAGGEEKMANFSRSFQKQLVYIGPIFTFIIVYTLPSIIGLYWITMTIFSIFQQLYLERSLKKSGFGV